MEKGRKIEHLQFMEVREGEKKKIHFHCGGRERLSHFLVQQRSRNRGPWPSTLDPLIMPIPALTPLYCDHSHMPEVIIKKMIRDSKFP